MGFRKHGSGGGGGGSPTFDKTVISGGASNSLNVGTYPYVEITLDADMELTITGMSLGDYGGATVEQDGTGNWELTLVGAELIGKLQRGPGEVTQFDIVIGADSSVDLVSQIDPDVGTDDLGNLTGAITVNFEHGPFDNKQGMLTGNVVLTLAAVRQKDFQVTFMQDGTGSRTVTWPASIAGNPPQPNPAPGTKSIYRFVFDGTSYHF